MKKICNKCGNEFKYTSGYFKNICKVCIYNNHKICGERTQALYPEEMKEWNREAAKITNKLHKKEKKEWGRKGGLKTHKLYPEEQKEWGRKGGTIGGKVTQRLYPNLHRETMLKLRRKYPNYFKEISKKAGLASILNQRKNSLYIFKNVHFDSYREQEIAMCLFYQYKIKLKEGINCHVIIGGKEFDFLIKKYKCFIEQHSFSRNNIDKNFVTCKKYFYKRRKILDKNGYKDYNLIVINN